MNKLHEWLDNTLDILIDLEAGIKEDEYATKHGDKLIGAGETGELYLKAGISTGTITRTKDSILKIDPTKVPPWLRYQINQRIREHTEPKFEFMSETEGGEEIRSH